MKKNIFIAMLAAAVAVSCVNLDEKVYSSLDKGVFYQDENSVKAELKDGVLTITFEKEKTEAPKKIAVQ